jgi:hypothetical protein
VAGRRRFAFLLSRRFGRFCSKRIVCAVPQGHWHTATFIADLRQDGLVAPGVFDGAINGEMFLAFVE